MRLLIPLLLCSVLFGKSEHYTVNAPPGSTIKFYMNQEQKPTMQQNQRATQEHTSGCLPCQNLAGQALRKCYFSLRETSQKELFARLEYEERLDLMKACSIDELRALLNSFNPTEWEELLAELPPEVQELWQQDKIARELKDAELSAQRWTAAKKLGMITGGLCVAAISPPTWPLLAGLYIFYPIPYEENTERSCIQKNLTDPLEPYEED
jgi:hypothetical protein